LVNLIPFPSQQLFSSTIDFPLNALPSSFFVCHFEAVLDVLTEDGILEVLSCRFSRVRGLLSRSKRGHLADHLPLRGGPFPKHVEPFGDQGCLRSNFGEPLLEHDDFELRGLRVDETSCENVFRLWRGT